MVTNMVEAFSDLKTLRKRVSLEVFMQINAKPRPILKKACCKDLSAKMLRCKRLDKWMKRPKKKASFDKWSDFHVVPSEGVDRVDE